MDKFIRTTDGDMADKLRRLGFQEIKETGTTGYLFLNNVNNYSEDSSDGMSKLSFSNMLNL